MKIEQKLIVLNHNFTLSTKLIKKEVLYQFIILLLPFALGYISDLFFLSSFSSKNFLLLKS